MPEFNSVRHFGLRISHGFWTSLLTLQCTESEVVLQVAIACRHGSIKDEVREYITRKSEKLLNHFARVTEIDVTIEFDSDRVSVEILLDAEHRHNFVTSVESTGDVIPVFDSALHKMDRQIRRYKGKIQDHRRDRPTHELTKDSSVDE